MAQHKLAEHWTGWVPQRPDHRDRIFNAEERVRLEFELPTKGGISLERTPPIWDQGQLGSCTAHGSLRVFLTEAMRQGAPVPMLSRLMQYYDSRALEGTTDQDAGASVRDAIKALVNNGCAPESEWPYYIAKFAQKPPAQAYTDAKQHLAVKYQSVRVGGPGAPMRTALHNGLAITFGFPVPASFEDGSWDPASGQPLPLPGPKEGFLGGHCVVVRAWDFSKQFSSGAAGSFRTPPFFTCTNSWGPGWGMKGEFNIRFDWFDLQRGLADDLWVIQSVT